MKKSFLLILFMVLLTGCGTKEPIKNIEELKALSWHDVQNDMDYYPQSTSVAFSPNGKYLVSVNAQVYLAEGMDDTTIRLWSAKSFNELKLIRGHTQVVTCIAFSPDGRHLASGSRDKTVKIWDLGNFRVVKTLEGFDDIVYSLTYSPDGKYLVSGGQYGTIKIWNAKTFEETRALKTRYVNSLAYSADGRYLACGGMNDITIWNIYKLERIKPPWGNVSIDEYRQQMEKQQVEKTLSGHRMEIHSVAFSPDSRYLAGGGHDGKITIWDTKTFEKERTLSEHDGFIFSVAFTPGGKYLVSGSSDQTIRFWDKNTFEETKRVTSHSELSGAIAISPDGRYLASGGEAVKVWKVSK